MTTTILKLLVNSVYNLKYRKWLILLLIDALCTKHKFPLVLVNKSYKNTDQRIYKNIYKQILTRVEENTNCIIKQTRKKSV